MGSFVFLSRGVILFEMLSVYSVWNIPSKRQKLYGLGKLEWMMFHFRSEDIPSRISSFDLLRSFHIFHCAPEGCFSFDPDSMS